MKKVFLVVGVLAVGIGAYNYYNLRTVEFVPDITTVAVTEGNVVDTVGATGALEAVTTVQVGSQVSGMIQELHVDYNSIVREGDVIMRLDPSLFETQVEQARANLMRAQADVDRLQVSVDDATTQLARAEDLSDRKLISETELEAAQVAVRSAEAQLKSTEAQVTQARASLNQEEVDLEHTVIRAPIDGIVISRLVDVGQTVAASLQAPELFVIAADLTKMRVIANIDESDVGRIRPDQRVTFTVDAFPGEAFEGAVSQIRLEPVIQQNVVTYATVIDAPNPDLKLKPGMTATITLEIARRENVTRIPNAALRFRPRPDMFATLNQMVPLELQQSRDGGRRGTALLMTTTPPETANHDGPQESVQAGGSPTGSPDPERRRQFRERMAQMSPEEREQFISERRAQRSGDAFDSGRVERRRLARRSANTQNESTVPAVERGASTIDALFAPLPPTESNGRVWLMQGTQLTLLNVRLGVTDGTATEFLGVLGQRVPPPQNPQIAVQEEHQESEAEEVVATPPVSLQIGTRLVTNITTQNDGSEPSPDTSSSPFIPQLPFGRGRRR